MENLKSRGKNMKEVCGARKRQNLQIIVMFEGEESQVNDTGQICSGLFYVNLI